MVWERMLVLTRHHRDNRGCAQSLSHVQDTGAILSRSVMSDSLLPLGLQPARFLYPWDSPGNNTDWSVFPCPPPGDLPNPVIEPRSLTLQADSLLTEQPGKPKNTGMGNLSLLQGIFPTQESNWGLLHCKQILYQLSYQRSPKDTGQGTNLWSSPLTYQCQLLGLILMEHFIHLKSILVKLLMSFSKS